MKLIWLAHETNLSGANICLLEYLQILAEKGFQSHLIIPYGGGGLAQKAGELNVPVYKVKYYSWARPRYSPPENLFSRARRWTRNKIAINQIRRLIETIEPGYVVTNTIATPVAAWAAHKAGRPHVWFIHEFGEEDHGFTIAGDFSKGIGIINRLSQKLVFNGVCLKQKYLATVAPDKCYVVHNPVLIPPVQVNENASSENFKMILLGQIAPGKNPQEAIEAIKICIARKQKVQLSIVGKAEDDQYLQQLNTIIHSGKMEEIISFPGPCNNPAEILSQHHALIMCSNYEAFGRVSVEALKCGLPVIAANTGGSLEIIEDGVNGYLYNAGNPASLADKIIMLNSNYHSFDRKLIAQRAWQKYNELNTAKELLNVFD